MTKETGLNAVAVLANLHVTLPSKERRSSKGTAALEGQGMKVKQGVAKIFPFSGRLKEVYAVKHQLYDNVIYPLTLPFDDKGWRILPNKLIQRVNTSVVEAFEKLDELKANLLRDYDYLMDEERELKGQLFDEAAYPTKAELEAAFSHDFSLRNMPTAQQLPNDVRISVGEETYAQLNASIERDVTERLQAAYRAAVEKVVEPVTTMIEQLKKPSEGSRIFTSLVENVKAVADVLPALNIGNCPTLAKVADDLNVMLDGLHVDDLKYNEARRSETLSKAEAIVETLKSGAAQAAPVVDATAAKKAADLDMIF